MKKWARFNAVLKHREYVFITTEQAGLRKSREAEGVLCVFFIPIPNL